MAETAIVLGSDGFLGRRTAELLEERGWAVYRVGRDAGDLVDRDRVFALFAKAPKAERIFHLVTRQRTGPIQYDIQAELLTINARIHLNVLEAWHAHQAQAKLISTGSSCAFPESDRPIKETAFQTGPMHDSVRGYGLAKQMLAVGSETYASQYGLSYLHVFLATVYGPRDHRAADRTHFMTGMIDRAVKEMREGKDEFTVWGSPETTRDLLYIDDQIEAIFAADTAFNNERLNVASGEPVTIGECAAALLDAMSWQVPIRYPEGTFQGAGYKTLDASRFRAVTQWSPRWNLEDGLRETIRQDY